MFVIGNLLEAIVTVISIILDLFKWLIIIHAVLSWFNIDPYNPIISLIRRLAEPVLNIVRSFIPSNDIGIDISPIVVFLIIIFAEKFVIDSLLTIALKMQ